MSQLTPFDYLGQTVRVVMSGGEPKWILSDVAAAVGARDAADLARLLGQRRSLYVNTLEKRIASELGFSGRLPLIVNEQGLYRILGKAEYAGAEPFQDWLYDEVLPAIRRDGGYISAQATLVQRDRLMEKINYLDLRDLLAGAIDYDSTLPTTRKAFAYMQNAFHEAVTGMTAQQIVDSGREIVTWQGKRGPTQLDRKVAKNYLSPLELKAEYHLGKIVAGQLGLWTLQGEYTMADFVQVVTTVIDTTPIRLP